MESHQLVDMRQTGDKTEMAMDVIESILSERGVAFSARAKVAEVLAEKQAEKQAEIDSLASILSRVVAQIIDGIIAFLLLLVLALFIHPFVGVAAFLLYILFQDALPNGQSIGKRILNIAVVGKATGNVCTVGQSFLRNITFVVLGIIDCLFALSQYQQRLGDRAANTIVVQVS